MPRSPPRWCLFFSIIAATCLAGIGRRPQRRQLFEMALSEANKPVHQIVAKDLTHAERGSVEDGKPSSDTSRYRSDEHNDERAPNNAATRDTVWQFSVAA